MLLGGAHSDTNAGTAVRGDVIFLLVFTAIMLAVASMSFKRTL